MCIGPDDIVCGVRPSQQFRVEISMWLGLPEVEFLASESPTYIGRVCVCLLGSKILRWPVLPVVRFGILLQLFPFILVPDFLVVYLLRGDGWERGGGGEAGKAYPPVFTCWRPLASTSYRYTGVATG